MGKKWKQWQILFSWAAKSLWMMNVPLKWTHLLFGRKVMTNLVCVCLVTHSCWTLCDPLDCSPPGSSVHGNRRGKCANMKILWKVKILFSQAPKSLQTMTAAMKLGRKTLTNLDNIVKCRDITLPTKVCIVKGTVFSSSNVQIWD